MQTKIKKPSAVKQLSADEKKAINILIEVANMAQLKGLFNLQEAGNVIQTINVLSPLLEVKEQAKDK